MEELTSFWENIDWTKVIPFVTNLAIGLVVLLLGFWFIKRISIILRKSLNHSKMASDVIPFLVSTVDVGLKVFLIFTVAGIVGIQTTSFVAIFGALAFAVGMALQGSLSNFAAGIIVMLFRPYKVGDWIEVHEKFGRVEEIQIFNTLIVTPGQKTLIIPNGQIVGNILTNYSRKGFIRIEVEVAMPYSESFPKVERIIREVLDNIPEVRKEPVAEIGIASYDTHYLVVSVRPYINPDDYWPVKFDVNQKIKNAFHRHQIPMAYSEGVELGVIGE